MVGKTAPHPLRSWLSGTILAAAGTFISAAHADFRDDIGFTQLRAEFGSALPTGSGVRLLQVEYVRDGAWAPAAGGETAGKTYTYLGAQPSTFSGHAAEVAKFLGGTVTSITPGVEGWKASEAWTFTGRNNLNAARTLAPIPATWDIENHSWGGNDVIFGLDILLKEDLRIDRDGVIACVGMDNGSSLSILLANGYNSIAVGSSTGNHPQAGSTVDTKMRMKPDLVGTANYTSYATPIVASCATLLVAEINRTPAFSAARAPMAIKALLLAGATKDEFPNWSHSPQQPLDRVWGAGEVNIQHSYKILKAGQQVASEEREVGLKGWDVSTTATAGRRLYFFSVPAGKKMKLSAVLAWHRHATQNPTTYVWSGRLENLDLKLWRASDFAVGAAVSSSVSTIDNVEHLYETSLLAGQYALEVSAPVGGERYGLAWNSTLVNDGSTGPTPEAPRPPDPNALLLDGSFEGVRVGCDTYRAFAYAPALAGWSFSGSAGLAGNNSGFTSGNSAAPDGTQVAFLQKVSSVSTQVELEAGMYTLAFHAANRANAGGQQTVRVTLDGQELVCFAPGTAYQSKVLGPFTLGAGYHTLAFAGVNANDATALLDNVVLSKAEPPIPLGNHGFETPEVGSNDYRAFVYAPALSAGSQDWLFQGAAGISGANSGFTSGNPAAPEGDQVAFFQSNTSSISQTVTLPRAGVYRLALRGAQRGNHNVGRQTLGVYLDGVQVGTVSASGTSYESLTVAFSAEAGTHDLSLRGLASGDCTLLLDAVTLQAPAP